MVEEIESIRKKVLQGQKEIIKLRKELKEALQINEKLSSSLLQQIIETVDEIESAEKAKVEKEEGFKNRENIKNQYQKIKSPILKLLKKLGVEKLDVPINKIPEYCKTVGTVKDSTRVNGTIVSVVKDGYRKDKKVIRHTHVIVVQN